MSRATRNDGKNRYNWRSRFKGGSGGSGGGGGGAGGRSAAATSERNALGQETSFGGEQRNVGNSRLFGANEEVQNISRFREQSAETQAGLIDSVVTQLRGRNDDGALTRRANQDLNTLYRNASPEARALLDRQGLADQANARNPSVRRLGEQAQRRQRQEEERQARQRQQRRSTQPRRPRDDDDDDLGGLFG